MSAGLLCLTRHICGAGMSERHLSAIGHHMSRLLSQHSQCLAALQSHRPAEAKKLAEAALQSADRLPGPAKALGPRHIWRVRLCEALMRACIDVGNQWQEALAVGLQLVPAYEMIYPKVCLACKHSVQCRSNCVAGQYKCASCCKSCRSNKGEHALAVVPWLLPFTAHYSHATA